MPQPTHAMTAAISVLVCSLLPAIAQSQTYDVLRVGGSPDVEAQADLFLLTDLNERLDGVGIAADRSTRRHVAFSWSPVAGARLVRFVADPDTIVINNAGMIAGTRQIARNPLRHAAFWFNDLEGSGFDELELPAGLIADAVKLTDSGILLVRVVRQSERIHTTFAVYQGRLYTLPDRAVSDVLDGGTTIGLDADDFPIIRRLDGGIAHPLDERTPPEDVTGRAKLLLGEAGHIAAATERFPNAVFWTGADRASVRRFTLDAIGLTLKRINRAGDVVGFAIPRNLGITPFFFHEGRFEDINQLAATAGVEYDLIADITDSGVMTVQSNGLAASHVLVPIVAGPPTRLVSLVSNGSVCLSWQGSPGATEYRVEAGTRPGLSDVLIASVGAATSVCGTAPPGTYYVRVLARRGAARGAPSNEVVVVIP